MILEIIKWTFVHLRKQTNKILEEDEFYCFNCNEITTASEGVVWIDTGEETELKAQCEDCLSTVRKPVFEYFEEMFSEIILPEVLAKNFDTKRVSIK